MNKAAIREQKKFVKRMSSGVKISKLMAFETEYDFYFQNNQGMFVVQSQLKYVDLKKLSRNKSIGEMMVNQGNFDDLRYEF